MVERKRWENNFSEWFQEIIANAEIMDYRYPVKGCGVWLPYGFKLRNNVINLIRKLLDEKGHEEILFPLMITSRMIGKESEHIGSFEEQIFWVTHAGKRELDEKLALRPTSETAIAPMLKLWIRSHADLPKKYYQIVSIFRYETKATRPLIRLREVTTFKEAHTSHESYEDAERQVKEAVEIYSKFFDELCLPYIISKRPEWDKFAGALYSIAYDTVFPDGRTLQIGTIHNLGQNFSKAFEITFETKDGSRDYIWQTCYGISERVIAAVIAVHGDDHGLVLPPTIAPIQIVIIPIPYKGYEEKVLEKCKKVEETLRKANLRVKLDPREKLTPGAKFFEWELKGVPLRIEVGPKDYEEETLTFVRRDSLERVRVKDVEVVEKTLELLNKIHESLRKRALKYLWSKVCRAESIEEVVKLTSEKPLIVETGWCGKSECGIALEEKTNLNVLGTPVNNEKPPENMKCLICGEKARFLVRIAKSY
mgnify:CR=1 FL=1